MIKNIKPQNYSTNKLEIKTPLSSYENEKIDQILRTIANIIVERLIEQKHKKAY